MTVDANEVQEIHATELAEQEGAHYEEAQKPEGMGEVKLELKDLEVTTKANEAAAFIAEST